MIETTTITTATRCPGCGHSTAAVETCPRCGWRLTMKLWERWLASKRRPRRRAKACTPTVVDDVPEAASADPPLTTIRQPHQAKGSEAVRLLLEGPEAESVLLPIELVVRASTAPAP